MLPEQVLFILGPARGGTTFMSDILQDWFGYCGGPEGTFVDVFYRKLPQYGDLRDDGNLDRFLKDLSGAEMLQIMRTKWPERIRMDFTPDLLRSHMPERSYAGALYAIADIIRERLGKRHLGFKDPDYWKHFDIIETVMGDAAHYVCILRDGRDVALSNYAIAWGQKNAWSCARTWTTMVDSVLHFQQRAPEKILVIRYEDILADPEAAALKLEGFLQRPLAPEVRAAFAQKIMASPMRQNYDKWRTQMSPRDVRIYEAVAGTQLAAAGYDLQNAVARVSPWEVASSVVGEYWRKVKLTLQSL